MPPYDSEGDSPAEMLLNEAQGSTTQSSEWLESKTLEELLSMLQGHCGALDKALKGDYE